MAINLLNNDLSELRDDCQSKSRVNTVLYSSTIALSMLLSGTFSTEYPPESQITNETSSYQFVNSNKPIESLSIADRYAEIAKSKWFKKTYSGKSLGEIIPIED